MSTSARTPAPCLRTSRDSGRLPWGLSPLRDASLTSPPTMSVPGSSSFRPQRFSRSRRLAPRRALQACFILLPRPGFALQGLPPPTRLDHLVSGPSLPAVGAARLCPVARPRQLTSRRPRGVHRTGIRNVRGGVSPGRTSVSPRAICSFGLRSVSLGDAVDAPSARALTVGAACAPAAGLQRIVD